MSEAEPARTSPEASAAGAGRGGAARWRPQRWAGRAWRSLRRGPRPDSAPPSRRRGGRTWLPYLLIVLAAGASIAGLAVGPRPGRGPGARGEGGKGGRGGPPGVRREPPRT
ncbi:hypothetical protein AB0F10_44915, partial [Actinoplanes sp. NPDC026623]